MILVANRLIAVSCWLWLITACSIDPGSRVSEITGHTMGTHYSIKIIDLPRAVPTAELRAAIESRLSAINQMMSTYLPDSELSQFNRSGEGDWVAVSPELFEVVRAAQQMSEFSDGAFDASVGPLVNLWGFGPQPRRDQIPGDEELATVRKVVGYQLLEIRQQPPALRKSKSDLYIDLSAIAKGYAVDQLAVILTQFGIADFLVEIGGEILARGHNAHDQPWRIAVEVPAAGARLVYRVMSLHDVGIATSGDYRNFFSIDGQRYSHTIDPSTGRPVEHNTASVTVVAKTAMHADAAATALLVMGPDKGLQLAEQLELEALYLLRHDERIEQRGTAGFARYWAH